MRHKAITTDTTRPKHSQVLCSFNRWTVNITQTLKVWSHHRLPAAGTPSLTGRLMLTAFRVLYLFPCSLTLWELLEAITCLHTIVTQWVSSWKWNPVETIVAFIFINYLNRKTSLNIKLQFSTTVMMFDSNVHKHVYGHPCWRLFVIRWRKHASKNWEVSHKIQSGAHSVKNSQINNCVLHYLYINDSVMIYLLPPPGTMNFLSCLFVC